ncbi:hypothetical protein HMPREF9551_00583 [Escherichia coli MS 196-1]|nr:hypothetical protein HMPREF9551_00583 [Escherichia coli MS 196-1]
MTNAKQPDALCLSGLHNPLNILNFKDFCRPGQAFTWHPA